MSAPTAVIMGVFALAFVAVAFSLVALTGRKRLQWLVIGAATLLLLAAAALSRFW